jgi:hypothetical protein
MHEFTLAEKEFSGDGTLLISILNNINIDEIKDSSDI